jgi:hypothetical protein
LKGSRNYSQADIWVSIGTGHCTKHLLETSYEHTEFTLQLKLSTYTAASDNNRSKFNVGDLRKFYKALPIDKYQNLLQKGAAVASLS